MRGRRVANWARRGAVVTLLVALFAGVGISLTPGSPGGPSTARAADADPTDYVSLLRQYFDIDTSTATDEELQALLGPYSDQGAILRYYVQTAQYGQHVLDPTDVSAQAAQLMAQYFQDLALAPIRQAVDDLVNAANDATYVNLMFSAGVTLSDWKGIADQLIEPLQWVDDITNLYLKVLSDRPFRELLVQYRDDRDNGEDVDAARADIQDLVPSDYLDYVGRLLGVGVDGLFSRLENAYDAMRYTSDPQRIEMVREFVAGWVSVRRYYSSGGRGQDHGLVIMPGAGSTVTVVDDGPSAVDGLKISTGAGDQVLSGVPSVVPGGRVQVSLASGRSLSDGTWVDFRVSGMWLRMPLNALTSRVWLAQPTASPPWDGGPWSFAVAAPVAPYGVNATVGWNFGDGSSGTGLNPQHVYACPGTYQATGTAATGGLKSLPRTVPVSVPDPYGTSWVSDTGDTGVAPQIPLTLRVGRSVPTDGSVTAHWTFGDGATGDGLVVTHAWTTDGPKTVTVTVQAVGSQCAGTSYTDYVQVGRSTDWVQLPSRITGTLTLSSAVAGYLLPPDTGTTVAVGGQLRIGPGIVVKGWTTGGYFATSSRLVVYGSLVASGTRSAPVVFTSAYDDAAGGDALADGATRAPQAGDWAGIQYGQVTGATPGITLDGVQVRYASTGLGGGGAGVTVSVSGSTFDRNGTGIQHSQVPGSTFQVQTSTISNAGTGVLLDVAAGSRVPVVRSSTFADDSSGVGLSGADGALLDGLTFTRVGYEVSASYGALRTVVRGTRVTDGPGRFSVSGNLPTGFTSWAADLPYVLPPQQVTIPIGGQLRLGPGVVVKGSTTGGYFATWSQFVVNGSLVATGTDAAPVVLTSLNDDSVGGDTLGDGSARSPQAGDWAGIVYGTAATGNPQVQLDRVQLRYAGTGLSGGGLPSSVSVTNSVLERVVTAVQHSQRPGSTFVVEDSTIRSAGTGAQLDVATGTTMPVLRNTTITDTGTGVSVSGADGALLDGLTFARVGYEVSASYGALRTVVRGTTVTDGAGRFTVSGNLPTGTTAWTADLPYVLPPQQVTIPAGGELQIGPGVVVKGSTTGGYFATWSQFVVNGSLVATGTDVAPVVLTSLNDDSAGGDTLGDGSARSPQAGDWAGITYGSTTTPTPPRVKLDHVDLRYAGTGLSGGGPSSVSVTTSRFSQVGTAIQHSQVPGADFLLAGSTLGPVTGGTAVSLAVSSGAATPVVRDNTITDAGTGVSVSGTDGALLDGLTFTRVGTEVSASYGALRTVVQGTTVTDGAGRFSVIGNIVPGVTSWTADLPYVLPMQAVTIPAGAELRIGPGVVVKGSTTGGYYANWSQFVVNGSLVATGTADAPVVLTSLNDDSAGGDTLGDGSARTPQTGDWAGISYGTTVTATPPNIQLSEVRIRYTATGLSGGAVPATVSVSDSTFSHVTTGIAHSQVPSSTFSVEHSTFAPDPYGTGVRLTVAPGTDAPAVGASTLSGTGTQIGVTVTGAGAALLLHDRLTALATAVSSSGGAQVDARDNWWGSRTGPAPTGTGTSVRGFVTVDPWCLDEDCLTDSANKPPVVTLTGPAGAVEGSTGRYTFTSADAGERNFALGTETCGDGGVLSDPSFDTSTGSGAFTCTFPDGPADTVVSVQVDDSQAARSDAATVAVHVDDVAPVVTLTGPATTDEGQVGHFTFTTVDPGQDQLSLAAVSCGDAGVTGPSTIDPVTGTGSLDCTFPDGPGASTVTVQVTDSDGIAGDPALVAVDIRDVAPTVVLDGPASVGEGGVGHYTVSASDPGQDTFALIAESCGDAGSLSGAVFDAVTGRGSFDCTFPEGPATSTVSARVADSDGVVGTPAGLAVTVVNLPPVVTAAGPASSVIRTSTLVQVAYTDPGVTDEHNAVVDWGDGSSPTSVTMSAATSLTAAHTYVTPGSYTVTVTVTDDAGASGTAGVVVVALAPDAAAAAVATDLASALTAAGSPAGPLSAAVADLSGNAGGTASNGAVSELQQGLALPALNRLLDAVVQLGATSAPTTYTAEQAQMDAVARSVAVEALDTATTQRGCRPLTAATCSRGERMALTKAQDLLAAADRAAAAGDYATAVTDYRDLATGL